jgi:Na+-driven multidrug efflux pump
VQLYVLFVGGSRIRVALADLLPRFRIMLRLIRLSTGGMLQTLISHSSWLVLVWIVGSFGAAAVAGYTIAIRLVIFAILPSWGLANAAATLVGQNLGAEQPDRAERSAWLAGVFNTVFLLGVAVVFVTAAGPLIRLFTAEAEVVAAGVSCLRWVSYGYPFYAWGMVMEQAFNGAGDTYTPTLINLACYWLFQLPMAWALAHTAGFDATGVFAAIMIAEAALAVVAVLVFRRGRWKSRTV